VTAGMASLAACSTRIADVASRAAWLTGGAIGWNRGQWVRGAKAGRNAGGRLESLPHKNSVDHKRSLHHKIRLPHKTRLRTRMSEPHQTLAPLRRLVKAHRPTTGKTAGVASLAACSTRGGGLRWSAQSCGPDGVGTRVAFGIVLLCRRDRRHGKPGGLLHENCRCGAQDCVVHGEAGVASRAACLTGGAIGWNRGQWVRGAKAGRNAGGTSDTTRRAQTKQTTARHSRNQTGVAAVV